MESAANRLQKEAKGYLDSLRGASVTLRTFLLLHVGCVDDKKFER